MSNAPFDIMRSAHAEYLVTDIDAARDFYVDALGMIVSSEDEGHIYLRGIEDRYHHSLLLTESEAPGIGHMAFRVRDENDLDRAALFLQRQSIPFRWLGEGEERGVGRALRFQDPLGFPVELFKYMDGVEWKLQKFHEHKGAHIMRLDHFNLFVYDLAETIRWYHSLGFTLTEYTEREDGMKGMWTAEMTRKQTSHDLGLMTGPGPRFHHAAFTVSDRDSLLDFADFISSMGFHASIERGPGRHGISNAYFLYVRDQDRHRVELYLGDYMVMDPDWKPVRWEMEDPRRQTFWGSPVPESWMNEAMNVRSVFTSEQVPVHEVEYPLPSFERMEKLMSGKAVER